MTKKTQLVTCLGLLTLLTPGVVHAQPQGILLKDAIKGGIRLVPSEFTQVVERAVAEQNIRQGIIGGARLATGSQVVTPPVQLERMGIDRIRVMAFEPAAYVAFEPNEKWEKLLLRAWKKPKDRDDIIVGAFGNWAEAEQVISKGDPNLGFRDDPTFFPRMDPRFVFLGALSAENFDLAQKILEKYKINVNILKFHEGKYTRFLLEILPDVQGDDKRILWLLQHGLDPNFIFSRFSGEVWKKLSDPVLIQAMNTPGFRVKNLRSGVSFNFSTPVFLHLIGMEGYNPNLVMLDYEFPDVTKREDSKEIFKALVAKGLDPMASSAPDCGQTTALHWYAQHFANLDGGEGDFLAAWVARFPKTDLNVRDGDGWSPAHYIEKERLMDQFGRLRGFDPMQRTAWGRIPEILHYYPTWYRRMESLRSDIEGLIIRYEFKGNPTAQQRAIAKGKAKDYSLNPKPEEFIEHLVSLGATPEAIEKQLVKPSGFWDEHGEYKYWIRKDLLDILYGKYGVQKEQAKPKSNKASAQEDPYPPYVYEENSEIDDGGWGFDDD